MHYEEIAPAAGLRRYLLTYWIFRGPRAAPHQQPVAHTAPGDGCASLFFILNKTTGFRKALLMGPTTTLIRTTTQPDSICLGIRAFPGLAEAAFGVSAHALRNKVVDGEDLMHKLGIGAVLESLDLDFTDTRPLDECLQTSLPRRPQAADEAVQKAVSLLMERGGNLPLSVVKEAAEISERQLQRRFMRHVGLSMKEFATTCRVRSTLLEAWVNQKDLFDTLYDKGYYDQAHFLHQLRKLSKSSPSVFKAHVAAIEHKGVLGFESLVKQEE